MSALPARAIQPATHVEKARRLLAMLERGQEVDLPPDQFRSLARDLVARLEARSPTPAKDAAPAAPSEPAPPAEPARAAAVRRSPLFSRPSPFEGYKPAAQAPRPPAVDHLASRPLGTSRDVLGRILAEAYDPEAASTEHPAIVALDLVDRSRREQADRLRQLLPGRIRAAYRYLKLLGSGACDARGPKIAEPTRTWVAPKAMASS
jgi:hypothetical protein